MTKTIRSTVQSIETAISTTKLRQEFKISKGVDSKLREHVVVRITDEQGFQGFGEASPLQFFTGETVEITKLIIDQYLAPITLGADPRSIDELHRQWNKRFPGYRAAKCALDVALHDLVARRANLTVADLLGGTSSHRLPLYKAIGFGTEEETLNEGERLWSLGLRTFKLKVGDTLSRDLSNLKVLRERFQDDVEIILDGNGGYTAQQAVRMLRKAWHYNVSYIEQPVPSEDIAGMAFVRAHGGVPTMADESVFTLRDAFNLIQAGAVDYFGIKLIKTGGFATARQVSTLAHEFGVKCVAISPFDTKVGIAANAMLASTFPAQPESQGLGTFFADGDVNENPFQIVDGHLKVPQETGLGVEVDPATFEGT